MSKYGVSKITTHVPDLQEVQKVLNEGLQKNFSNVSVNIVDCPDLTQPPFHLSSEGLGGNPRLADVGGPSYLLPLVQRDKIYNYKSIAEQAEIPNAFIIGAGAGPAHVVGVNSELMTNIKYENDKVINNTYICRPDIKNGGCILEKPDSEDFCLMGNFLLSEGKPGKNGGCILEKPDSEDFCLMGNFLLSEGKPGKVLEVKASKRCGKKDFVACTKNVLKGYYGDKPVAVGGVFLIEKGSAHLHLMPDLPTTPLNTREDLDNWLNYYDMSPPLVTIGVLVSHDPGYDLREEHFHCFSMHGEGGHYHWDTTPDEVEYRAYFTLAEYIYRIDQPETGYKLDLKSTN